MIEITNDSLSDVIVEAVNKRIASEKASYRIYQYASEMLSNMGLSGAAALWSVYSEEEMKHADKASEHLRCYGLSPAVVVPEEALPSMTTLLDVVRFSYNHEVEVMKECQNLATLALRENDLATFGLAQWFINEQIEEYGKLRYWMDRFTLCGEANGSTILVIDSEMMKMAKRK